MNYSFKKAICFFLFISTFLINTLKANTSETLEVKHFDDLNSSLSSDVSNKLISSKSNSIKYISLFGKNNGSISIRNKKNENDSGKLATTTFENTFAINSTNYQAPTSKNTVYELLTKKNGKETFAEIAFLDANTVVTLSFNKKDATLLFIDISNNQMNVTAKINVPVCKINSSNTKEFFYVDADAHQIVLSLIHIYQYHPTKQIYLDDFQSLIL